MGVAPDTSRMAVPFLALVAHLIVARSSLGVLIRGVAMDGVRLATYELCATLAGLCGFLLSCVSGEAARDMGAEDLLISIAVVVIGGSSVAGGNSNVPGIWGRRCSCSSLSRC